MNLRKARHSQKSCGHKWKRASGGSARHSLFHFRSRSMPFSPPANILFPLPCIIYACFLCSFLISFKTIPCKIHIWLWTIHAYIQFPVSPCIQSLYSVIDCHNVLFWKCWKNRNYTFKVQPTPAHRFYCTFILLLHHYPHYPSSPTHSLQTYVLL